MKRILTNNIGYDSLFSKKAILQTDEELTVSGFRIFAEATGETLFRGCARKSGPVARWNKGDFFGLQFDLLGLVPVKSVSVVKRERALIVPGGCSVGVTMFTKMRIP